MALSKFKQKNRDEVLDKASRSEHGLARLAHLNVVVEEVNKIGPFGPFATLTREEFLGRVFFNSGEAIAAGLVPGDIFHTPDGTVKIVTE